MRKFIFSAVAVAALGIGGAAQADLIDGVGTTLSRIFGVPYDPRPDSAGPIVSVYTDAYGRRVQVDAYGRHYPVDQAGSYRDQWGRTVYLGADTYAVAPSYDSDGDGVADPYDRLPQDPRYR